MNHRRHPKSRAAIARRRARDINSLILSLILSGLVIVVVVILYATGWWLTISGWAGDIIAWAVDPILEQFKEQAEQIGNTQPE